MKKKNLILFIFFLVFIESGFTQNTDEPRLMGKYQIEEDTSAKIQGIPIQVSNGKYSQIRRKFRDNTSKGLLVPLDDSFELALGPNDDGHTSEIELPFDFNLFGDVYTSFYINNNGNISFNGGYSQYTSTGFPVDGFPMLAPFWADVDTRPAGSGLVYFKVDSNRVIVTWNQVGYYNNNDDKLNTFQVIFSNGTDPEIGLGNNVAFSFGQMEWTTGSASNGVNGFGGVPATVGVNRGDGIYSELIGRFDEEGDFYDGPGGLNDGVNYLTNKIFVYNISTADFDNPDKDGIYIKIIETADTNVVKSIGFQYQYVLVEDYEISYTKNSDIFLVNNGTVILKKPNIPPSAILREDFMDEIILYNEDDERVGYINYSYSFKYEDMHSRHVWLFFHNDASICESESGVNYFPFSEENPNNPPGKMYNYYEPGDYPVSMLIPPHFQASDDAPEGYRFPVEYNAKPLLFVHGLTGTFSYAYKNRVDNTETEGDQVSYWYDTERKLNHMVDENNQRKYHAWQFYYPNEDDITHCGLMLGNALDVLRPLYQDDINIIAHSMGGLVTMEHLTLDQNYQDRVGKVFLSMSPIHGSLGGNRNYRTDLGHFLQYFGQDGKAPAYRDLSIGSDFLTNLHARTWPVDLVNNTFSLIGLTNKKYQAPKPVNLIHREAEDHNDGIVSFSSASLIDKGVGFVGVYGNHDDGRFSKTLQNKSFLPNLLDQYFSDPPGNFEGFLNYSNSDSLIEVVVDGSQNILKPDNIDGFAELEIDRSDVRFDKGHLTMNLLGVDSERLFIYKRFYPYKHFILKPNKNILDPFFVGRFNRNIHAIQNDNSSSYYYTRKLYEIDNPNPLLPGIPLYWADTGFEYFDETVPLNRKLNSGVFICIGLLESKTMQNQFFPFMPSRMLMDYQMTAISEFQVNDNSSSPSGEINIDNQTSELDFLLFSQTMMDNIREYSINIINPDGVLYSPGSPEVEHYSDPYTGLQVLSLNNPVPGKWQVLPVIDFEIQTGYDFRTFAHVESQIIVDDLLANTYNQINQLIELTLSIKAPILSEFNLDSLHSEVNIYRDSVLVESIIDQTAIQFQDSLTINPVFSLDSVGYYNYDILVKGYYESYKFDRVLYGDFFVEDTSPTFNLPDLELDDVNNYIEIELLDYLIGNNEHPDSLIDFNVQLFSSSIPDSLFIFNYFIDEKKLAIGVLNGIENSGEIKFVVDCNISDSFELVDTMLVYYYLPGVPRDVIAYDINYSSASITWTPANFEEEWDVLYGLAGFDVNSDGVLLQGITNNFVELSDLLPETSYEVYVRGVEEDNALPWSLPIEFTTLVCPLPSQPDTIFGPNSVCTSTIQTYSVTINPGATSYTWTLPSGWSGSSNTNTINATVGSSGGSISVTANNSCGSSTPRSKTVSVSTAPSQPDAIGGADSPCQGSVEAYSVSEVSGATSYTWTLPSGWSGSSDTNSINATVGSSGGSISVTANNDCGSGTPRSKTVSVTTLPTQPGPITGPTTVPNGNQASYSISDVDGATSYSWNYSGEGSISGSGLSIALTPTSSGTLSVLAQNECGDGQPSSLNITVPGLPSVFVNPSSLSFGDVTVGSHSSPQTYLLSASNLTENLIVQASLGFEVSETGSNYVTSLSIVPVDGSIDSKTIYVRFSPGIEGPYDDGIITNESSGESQDVEVTGTGVILPYITLVPSGYDYGSEYVGECSSSYTFTLTNSGGGIATGNVVLSGTDSNSFEIMNGGGSFSLASGDSKDISVIFCPASAGSKTGSLEALGSDETNSASASLSGIGEEPGSPVITATPDYLDFGDVVINSQSVPLSYSLSGNNLDGEITISSDANEYEVSLYQNSGYSNSLTLLPDEGTLNVQIWVIFTPDNLGIQTATISNSSIGATTREVLVSGNGITDEDEFYTIITSFLPAEGGSVHGAGTFPKNSEASLVALPNTNHGFHFYKWVEEGEEDRYENPLAIVVDNNRSFTAHFTNLNYILLNTYSVETSTESDFIQLTVTADQPWVAMPEKDWLSVYPNHGGSGSSEVMVAWLDNPDSEMREAAVVFHNEVADAFFMVKQGLPVSVSELSEEDILVFPNPAQDELKIHNIPHGSYFFITDVQGSEVMRVEQPGKEMFLDISNLQPGFYSLVVVTRDQRIVKKVILF